VKKIIALIVLAALIVGLYYFVFSKNEWERESPISGVFVSDEEKYINQITDKEVQKYVFYTLPEKVLRPGYGGKVFCSNKLFGYEKDIKENSVTAYVYAYCEEYYLRNDKPTLGSGVSCPVRLVFTSEKNGLVLNYLSILKDGDQYANSIRDVFPKEYQEEAIQGIDTTLLIPAPKTQAENYYKGKLEVYF